MIGEGAPQAAAGYSYPGWVERFPASWVRVVVYYLVMLPVTRLMCWARVEGKQRLDDLRGPALFISNHIAMVDPGLILAALPGRYSRNLAVAMEGERLRGYRNPPHSINGYEARSARAIVL